MIELASKRHAKEIITSGCQNGNHSLIRGGYWYEKDETDKLILKTTNRWIGVYPVPLLKKSCNTDPRQGTKCEKNCCPDAWPE